MYDSEKYANIQKVQLHLTMATLVRVKLLNGLHYGNVQLNTSILYCRQLS